MKALKYAPVCLLLYLAAGCSRAPTPTTSLELPPLEHHIIDREALRAEVESAAEPLVADDNGAHHVIIPLGTTQPIHCFVYPKPINLAQSLRMLINGVLSQVEPGASTRIAAGGIDGAPYLQATTHYRLRKGDRSIDGEVKYLASRSDDSATMCMHDELGYDATFLRVVTGFVASQDIPADPGNVGKHYLVWRAVSLENTQDSAVGVIESRLYEGEGGYAFATAESVLRPGSDGSVQAYDEAEHQYSNLDGAIVAAKYIKISDDAVTYNLDLTKTDAGYVVKGTSNGAQLEGPLAGGETLPDFVSRTAELRRLYADKKTTRTLSWEAFSPDEPTHTVNMKFTKKASARDGVLVIGTETRNVVIDELGIQESVTSDQASVQRVWQAGHS